MQNDGLPSSEHVITGVTADLDAKVAADLTGSVLEGKYWLVRKADEGGNGSVYEGFDIQLGRRIAIKVLNSSATTEEAISRSFAVKLT